MDELAEEDKFYLSDDYKRNVLEHMSTSQLLDMLLIHPTVHVSPSYRDTGLTASYTFKPLSNLVRWYQSTGPQQHSWQCPSCLDLPFCCCSRCRVVHIVYWHSFLTCHASGPSD